MRLSLVSVAVLAAALSACASDPGAPGGGGVRAPAGPQVFFSPFGEPFRAAPGEPYPVAAWFAGADTNGDGALMLDEFTADGMRYFAVLDRDRDGEIGPGEVAVYEALADQAFGGVIPAAGEGFGGGGRPMGGRPAQLNMAEPQAGMPQQGGNSGMDQGLGSDRPRAARSTASTSRIAQAGLLGVPQPVKSADANFNQYITRQEWTAVAQRWFGLLDADHDGKLTLAELPHTALQRGEDGRAGRAPPRVRN